MFVRIMKWICIAALLLALLWPSSAGYRILLMGFAVCAGAILAAQARRAGKYFWKHGYAIVSPEVEYENSDSANSLRPPLRPKPSL
jgi:hypothetical protein